MSKLFHGTCLYYEHFHCLSEIQIMLDMAILDSATNINHLRQVSQLSVRVVQGLISRNMLEQSLAYGICFINIG